MGGENDPELPFVDGVKLFKCISKPESITPVTILK